LTYLYDLVLVTSIAHKKMQGRLLLSDYEYFEEETDRLTSKKENARQSDWAIPPDASALSDSRLVWCYFPIFPQERNKRTHGARRKPCALHTSTPPRDSISFLWIP